MEWLRFFYIEKWDSKDMFLKGMFDIKLYNGGKVWINIL